VGSKVSAIAASSKEPNVVYVAFVNGVVEVSTDGGETFEALASEPFTEQFVTGLSVNPSNSKEIVASFSFYDTRFRTAFPHVALYSYSTTPASGAWSKITGNLPSFGVSRVVYWGKTLAAATDRGVYAAGAPTGESTAWSRLATGLPNVQVQDLEAAPDGLYAVTFGRGAWRLPNAVTLPITVCGAPCVIPILGKGYPPEENVRVILDGETLVSLTTDTRGTFNARVQIPAATLPGLHTISVLDSLGNGAHASFLERTDWLSARFDTGQSGFAPETDVLAPAIVGSLRQTAAPQWGAFVHSAPIYAAGEVYAGSDDGTVRAFDPMSGRQLWSFAGQGAFEGSPAGVPASPSSALNKGCAVVAGSTNGIVYGLDPGSGNALWSFNAGAPITSSPVVFRRQAIATLEGGYNVVVTAANGSADVLDACTGAPLWSQGGLGSGQGQTPALLAEVRLTANGALHTIIVVCFGQGSVRALDAATGALIWSQNETGPVSAPSAVRPSGMSARVALADGSRVKELQASTGRVLWSTETRSNINGGVAVQLQEGSTTPAGTVFAVNETGEALALAGETGVPLWSTTASFAAATQRSAPTLANGVLYFTSAPTLGAPGTMQALQASDGKSLFTFELGSTATGPLSGGPSLADARVLVGDFSGGLHIFAP
jgi:outer membrane protein assembly factor BamB